MFTTKKLQISQNLYYITVLRSKQKFVLLPIFSFWAYLWFSISTQVSPVNNLDFFSFIEVCPHRSKTHRSISHRYISLRLRCRGSIRLSSISTLMSKKTANLSPCIFIKLYISTGFFSDGKKIWFFPRCSKREHAVDEGIRFQIRIQRRGTKTRKMFSKKTSGPFFPLSTNRSCLCRALPQSRFSHACM